MIRRLLRWLGHTSPIQPIPSSLPSTSGGSAPIAVPAIAPAVNVGNSTASSTFAVKTALDKVWQQGSNSKTRLVPAGKLLWHSGIVSRTTMVNNHPIWLTSDASKKHYYDSWAKGDAQRLGCRAYHLEVKTVRDLKLADFGCQSLSAFTVQHCNSNHSVMVQSLADWATSHGLNGVVGVNGGPDEHFLIEPLVDVSIESDVLL